MVSATVSPKVVRVWKNVNAFSTRNPYYMFLTKKITTTIIIYVSLEYERKRGCAMVGTSSILSVFCINTLHQAVAFMV